MANKIHNLVITVDGNQETARIIGSLIKNEKVLEIVNEDNGIIKSSSSPSVKIYIEHIGLQPEKISRLLIKLGLIPNHSGFHYVQAAIEYNLSLGSPQFCITKDIYPHIAKRFSSTIERVERCIRKSVDYAWANGGKQSFEEMAGCPIYKKPTNAQFISFVSEYIKANRERFYKY